MSGYELYSVFPFLFCLSMVNVIQTEQDPTACSNVCNSTVSSCYSCPGDVITLSCLPNEVVTAEVKVGYRPNLSGQCCEEDGDCQTSKTIQFGPSMDISVETFQLECVWRCSQCDVIADDMEVSLEECSPLDQSAYLKVYNFLCIAETQLFRLPQTAPTLERPTDVIPTQSEGFITSPGYPSSYWSSVDDPWTFRRISFVLETSRLYVFTIETYIMDMPSCQNSANVSEGLDYLEISFPLSPGREPITWCGNQAQRLASNENEVRISLVIGTDENEYKGFVLRYAVTPRLTTDLSTMPSSMVPTNVLSTTHRSTSNNKPTVNLMTMKIVIIVVAIIGFLLLSMISIVGIKICCCRRERMTTFNGHHSVADYEPTRSSLQPIKYSSASSNELYSEQDCSSSISC